MPNLRVGFKTLTFKSKLDCNCEMDKVKEITFFEAEFIHCQSSEPSVELNLRFFNAHLEMQRKQEQFLKSNWNKCEFFSQWMKLAKNQRFRLSQKDFFEFWLGSPDPDLHCLMVATRPRLFCRLSTKNCLNKTSLRMRCRRRRY